MVFTITVWFTVDHYFLIIMSSYNLVYYLVEMITIFVSLCRTIVIGMITFCDPCRLNIIMDYDCVLYNIAVYQLSVRVSILPTLKNSCIIKLFQLRKDVLVHKTSCNHATFYWSACSKEIELLYIWVFGIPILLLFTILLLDFGWNCMVFMWFSFFWASDLPILFRLFRPFDYPV
jgi:hypothetical protein